MKLTKRDINGDNLITYFRDDSGNSLLHIAVINNDMNMFSVCARFKKLINLKNKCNETPLHLCAEFNRVDMAKILLKKCACQDMKNILDWTPLFQAIMSGSVDVFDVLINTRYNRFLYNKKIIKERRYLNPFCTDLYGLSIVHYAYLNKDKRYIEFVTKKLKEYNASYVILDEPCWRNPHFIKIYTPSTFKEEQYNLNKEAFSHVDSNWKRNNKTT